MIPSACRILLACGDIDYGGDADETGWDPESRTCTWEGAEYDEDATFGPADGCVVYQCTPQGVQEIQNDLGPLTGDVTLETQAELSALICATSVQGTLILGGGDATGDIADLEPLHNLQSIGGDLVISQHSQLVSLAGLSALSSVGNDLWVEANPA